MFSMVNCHLWLVVNRTQRSQSKLWSVCASNSEKIHYIRLDLSLNADKLKLQTEFLCFLDENSPSINYNSYIVIVKEWVNISRDFSIEKKNKTTKKYYFKLSCTDELIITRLRINKQNQIDINANVFCIQNWSKCVIEITVWDRQLYNAH